MEKFEYLFDQLWDDDGTLLVAGDTVCLNGEKTEIGLTAEGKLFFIDAPAEGIIQSLKLGPCDQRPGPGGSDDAKTPGALHATRKETVKMVG